MHLEVREAGVDDFAEIAEIQRRAVLTCLKDCYDPDAVERWAWSIHAEKFAILHGKGEVLLVVGDRGSIKGFSSYRAGDCHLGMWYVDPDFQGEGVGKALLSAAEEGLSVHHCEAAWAEASLFARPRFETLGWGVESEYDKPFAGATFHVFRMTKVLA